MTITTNISDKLPTHKLVCKINVLEGNNLGGNLSQTLVKSFGKIKCEQKNTKGMRGGAKIK